MPHPPHLDAALRIGSEYQMPTLRYSPSDNTYVETPRMVRAWACPLSLRPAPEPAVPDLLT